MDPRCNMLQTLLRRKNYEEGTLDEQLQRENKKRKKEQSSAVSCLSLRTVYAMLIHTSFHTYLVDKYF